MKKKWLSVFIGLVFSASCIGADNTSDSGDKLLGLAKQATGGAAWDHIDTLHEQGRISGAHVDGSYDSVTDLLHILSLQKTVLGPMVSTQGWDGKVAWSSDSSGQVRVESSREAIAAGLEQAYRSAYGFFWPDRWPATRASVGERHADGVNYDAVKVTPKGAEPFELWLDRSTHRIAREVDLTGAQPHTQIFSDYRAVDGVMLPFATRDTVGDVRFDVLASASTLAVGPGRSEQSYAPATPPKEGDPFPAGRDRISLPFRLINNHIYVSVSINGKPEQPFVFDTGGVFIVDTSFAPALGIKPEGQLPGSGFGENVAAMRMGKVHSLALGGFTLNDQVALTMDISASMQHNDDVNGAGIVGYEIPKRAIVVLDYAKGEMTLVRPAAFKPPAGATVVPFTFNAQVPMIAASVDGMPGEFEIDTGSASGLDIMGPFAKANHLAERYHATHEILTGGAGGASSDLLARASSLKIGDLVIDKPVVDLVGGTRGAGAATLTAGNIGGALLRRFTLTLDYGNRKLYFQPNAAYGTPDGYNRSGVQMVRASDQGIVITHIISGSAAEKAGLQAKDRIVAVDGTKARDVHLTDLRDKFNAKAGTRVTLSVSRNGSPANDVVLVLNDII